MLKKHLKSFGVFLALTSLSSLFLPIFSTLITDGEAWNMVVRGYNMVEFSPWGSVVLMLPIILIGLALSKLKNNTKTVMLFGLILLDGVALYNATAAMHKWVLEQATGHVQVQPYYLIYALLLLLVFVYVYIECNFLTEDENMKLKEYFETEKIHVEPVDYRKEKFFLINKPYEIAKYDDEANVTSGQSHICFATEDGYFAGFNDNDTNKYFCIELMENEEAIGFVTNDMPTGLCGNFYEDYDFRKKINVEIKPFEEISDRDVSLSTFTENGEYLETKAKLCISDKGELTIELSEDGRNVNYIGSAVFQDDKLVAFATEYDERNAMYKCMDAELMAVDLCRKIYEDRVSNAINEYKNKSQIE